MMQHYQQQQQSQLQLPQPMEVSGSTPIGSIGASQVPDPGDPSSQSQQETSLHFSGDLSDEDCCPHTRQKRGVLPKQATNVMRSWLFQHIVHPYPSEDEKRQISGQTNLSLLQVNNWFINARRRILQPMLESTPCQGQEKTRKAKPVPTKPAAERFWPQNLRQSQDSGPEGSNSMEDKTIQEEPESGVKVEEEAGGQTETNLTNLN